MQILLSHLGALSELIKIGKIRNIGLSNETPGNNGVIHQSKDKDLPKMQSIQNAYNLLNRIFEFGGSEIAFRESVGLLHTHLLLKVISLGSIKMETYQRIKKELFDRLQRYEGVGSEEAIESYLNIAKKYNVDPSQLANQFVTTRPFVTSNIIGATSMEQLKLAVTSIEVNLTEEIKNDIEKPSKNMVMLPLRTNQ